MSGPIALGQRLSLPILNGDSALTAPTTPGKRMPVVDKSKVDPGVLKAAQGMEAMFLDQMMSAMRKTIPKSDMALENAGTQLYQGMLDTEMAQTAARTGGVGLADQIVAYMQTERYNQQREHAAPDAARGPSSTGGTHEGEPSGK